MITKKHIYTEQEALLKLSALCASAEYCEEDLRKKMRNWDFNENDDDNDNRSAQSDEDIKDLIIAKLREEKFIDDKRYAHAFVRDKFRYNHWGKVRIIQELRMRMIDSSIIDEALSEIPDEDNLDTLRQLIESKKKSVKGKSDYEIRCKLIRFALGKGFQMDDIIKVVGDFD